MTSSILVTRPQPGADATAARLRALGMPVVLAPMLRVRALPLRWPPRVQAALVTSGQALPSLRASVPVLAVGDATAARARALGLGPVQSASGDAAALAALAGAAWLAGLGPWTYPALLPGAALLAFQAWRLDPHDPAGCLQLFRLNREAGLLLGLALLAGRL